MSKGNSYANGPGLPFVRAKDWQFRQGVFDARVTHYDFP